MFARLRGVPEHLIDSTIKSLAEELLITQHLENLFKNYRFVITAPAVTMQMEKKTSDLHQVLKLCVASDEFLCFCYQNCKVNGCAQNMI